MPTFFEGKKSFADVPVTDKGVDTPQFLEAAEALVKLFDLLGSAAFSVVQNDMTGNIKKIRDRYLTNTEANATLESLVDNERGEKKRTATEGLVWLFRGLAFTAAGLRRSIQNKSEELAASFTQAYEGTLKKYHSFVVRPVFGLAMRACPYRQAFYEKLGSPQEVVQAELEKWLGSLEVIVGRIEAFVTSTAADKGGF